jgi:hypothetical protein
MPLACTKPSKFQRHAFCVDFGHGPVYVQRCGELHQGTHLTDVVIERGLSRDSTFADLMSTPIGSVTVYQTDRERQVRIAYTLNAPKVVAYSVGPWDAESSEFTLERLTIEYTGFKRTDLPVAAKSADKLNA